MPLNYKISVQKLFLLGLQRVVNGNAVRAISGNQKSTVILKILHNLTYHILIHNVLFYKNYAWANPKGAFYIWINLPPEIVAKKQ